MTSPAEPPHRPFHLRATILPEQEPRDIWIADGAISFDEVPGATTLTDEAWVLPGLVDAHCHVGLSPEGQPIPVDPREQERQARTDRDTGVLLIRDAGSPSDTRWIDGREDLLRIVRAGRHIARPKRYIRGVAVEIEPDQLAETMREQALAGDGWVKLVGDWIDRSAGDLTPLWDEENVRAGIAAAHEAGARVTAHCFAEDSVARYVDAGIDCIEHGTGISDDVMATMAERQIALVPTMINLENFPVYAAAGEAKFPRYATHMRALHARRLDTLRKAREAGVPIYAGTDAGGVVAHGRIADEIEALASIGDSDFALGAASWRARSWLGASGLEEGSSADLVVYDADPRVDVRVVRDPRYVILRGRIVRG